MEFSSVVFLAMFPYHIIVNHCNNSDNIFVGRSRLLFC